LRFRLIAPERRNSRQLFQIGDPALFTWQSKLLLNTQNPGQ